MKKVSIASDHHGVVLKAKIVEYLKKKNYEIIDCGPDKVEAVDYPVYAFKVANTIVNKEAEIGILICYTGIGMSIACNRLKNVRCARVTNVDDAKHARLDNDANVVAFSSQLPLYAIYDILDAFLNTEFSRLERHQRRIDLMDGEINDD